MSTEGFMVDYGVSVSVLKLVRQEEKVRRTWMYETSKLA